jgi:hypothetical protein
MVSGAGIAVRSPAIATTAAAAAPATATAGAGFGFVNANAAAHPFDVLEVVDGGGLLGVAAHLHEGETALATGVAIQGQAALAHASVGSEQLLQILHFGIEGEVADINGHELLVNGETDSSKALKKVAGLEEKSVGKRRAGEEPAEE